MSYREYWKEQNAEVEERNSLVFGRIQEIMTESVVDELYQDYFSKAAARIACFFCSKTQHIPGRRLGSIGKVCEKLRTENS